VVAFAGAPVFQALSVLMSLAVYGIAANRRWARLIGQIAVLAGMAMITATAILGFRILGELVGAGINVALLATVSWYLERPSIRLYMATAISRLPDRITRVQ
jgi:hypothetical protein